MDDVFEYAEKDSRNTRATRNGKKRVNVKEANIREDKKNKRAIQRQNQQDQSESDDDKNEIKKMTKTLQKKKRNQVSTEKLSKFDKKKLYDNDN